MKESETRINYYLDIARCYLWNTPSEKFNPWELPWALVFTVHFNSTLDKQQSFASYQCLVCRSGEPAVVMYPLVHSRGMVTNPLNDIIHIDDVCRLYIERPKEGNIYLTKNIQAKVLEVSHCRE